MLAENIKTVREKVEAACRAVGRTNDVRILAAVKTVPPERILELKRYGIDTIGENRVSEFTEKYPALAGQFDMHFIGALQTNKVGKIVGRVSLIHSVDRPSLVDELDRKSAQLGICTNILLEVNVGREASKSGVFPEQFDALAAYALTKPALRLKGVMSVLPIAAPDELYGQVRSLYKRLQTLTDGIDTLSMGMSGDYETAIRHGANLIRIGSALFGKRVYEVQKNV